MSGTSVFGREKRRLGLKDCPFSGALVFPLLASLKFLWLLRILSSLSPLSFSELQSLLWLRIADTGKRPAKPLS